MNIRSLVTKTAAVYAGLNTVILGAIALVNPSAISWKLLLLELVCTIFVALFIVLAIDKLPSKNVFRRNQITKKISIPHFRNAVSEDIPEICRLEKLIFNEVDALPESVGYRWLKVNKGVFTLALNENNEIIGYYLVLPLKEDILKIFIQGRVNIISLTEDCLLSETAMWKQSSIYLGSFVVLKKWQSVLVPMLFHLARKLERARKYGLTHVYALGATPEGERIIRDRYKFRMLSSAADRVDKHDLYIKDIRRFKALTDIVLSRLLD